MWLKQTDVDDFSLPLFFLKNAGRAQNWQQATNISTQPTKPLELELKWGSSLRVHAKVELFLVLASTWKPKAPQLTHPYFSVPSVFAIRHFVVGDWLDLKSWVSCCCWLWVHLEEMVPCLWVLQRDGPLAADRKVLSCHPTARTDLPLVVAIWLFSLTPLIALLTLGSPWPLARVTDTALTGCLTFSLFPFILLTEVFFL